MLEQVKNLKNSFEKPLLIIEGTENIYSQRNIHANALRGMIAAITIDYGIPIIYTYNEQDTANYLIQIAKREQQYDSDFSFHANKTSLTANEELEYIVSSMPGVGPNIAKRLLVQFKTVQNIMKKGDVVLIKGSQGMRMEYIVKEVMGEPEKASELLVRQTSEWT